MNLIQNYLCHKMSIINLNLAYYYCKRLIYNYRLLLFVIIIALFRKRSVFKLLRNYRLWII